MPKELERKIKFLGKIQNIKLWKFTIERKFCNLSSPDLFNKSILEVMACENLVLVSDLVFENILPEYLIFKEKILKVLKIKSWAFLKWKKGKEWLGRELREKVIQNNTLRF